MTTRRWFSTIIVAGAALVAAGDRSLAAPPDAPPDLRTLAEKFAPKGWELASAVFARGVETYAPTAGAWVAKGATADLFALESTMKPKAERAGALFPGYQGLTWDFGTGRRAHESAEILEGATGADIEWMRVTVRHFSDAGSSGGWSYILQVHTRGGKAPTAAPAATDADWVGAPFTAYYVFLKPKR